MQKTKWKKTSTCNFFKVIFLKKNKNKKKNRAEDRVIKVYKRSKKQTQFEDKDQWSEWNALLLH